MTEENESILSSSFYSIHNIISRGLQVSIQNAMAFSRGGFLIARKEGYTNYVRTLVAVIDVHHLSEDDIVFPYFRDKIPEVPFYIFQSNHREMAPVFDEIRLAVDRSEMEGQLEAGLRALEIALNKLNGMWHPHINLETEQFIKKTDGLISNEEQIRLVKLFREHGQSYPWPTYLAIPFMLYNLPLNEREIFAQDMPDEVINNMVPIVWKEKWASMKPFLLD